MLIFFNVTTPFFGTPHFNTSHVNVNPFDVLNNLGVFCISIHLMLMLICLIPFLSTGWYFISIHLMLMLIRYWTYGINCVLLFQYISC